MPCLMSNIQENDKLPFSATVQWFVVITQRGAFTYQLIHISDCLDIRNMIRNISFTTYENEQEYTIV